MVIVEECLYLLGGEGGPSEDVWLRHARGVDGVLEAGAPVEVDGGCAIGGDGGERRGEHWTGSLLQGGAGEMRRKERRRVSCSVHEKVWARQM